MSTDKSQNQIKKQKDEFTRSNDKKNESDSSDNSSNESCLTSRSNRGNENNLFLRREFSSPKVVKAAHNIIKSPICPKRISFDHKEPKIVVLNNRPISTNLLLDSPRHTIETEYN